MSNNKNIFLQTTNTRGINVFSELHNAIQQGKKQVLYMKLLCKKSIVFNLIN